ncbi:NAD(P)-binding domain-containing protein [Rhodococcus fascians]|uniref:NADPH-dependent F420 reductase n=1 Tax=Rhodococcoides fascians TaxID=1828 RepID=UPI001961FA5D|nr:NAD(P)-binding domain-containing protein [Rhodococcus fascians]MBM7246229.1 NAD(P)-binding domain-containing protein [Rhodococcus fascians]MBY3812040.1 NAD(P)-binding domain-containing protein [Rhodococcus fascians]MBY3843531.1 NAD(P)-binding domain-containing protein [Rhodococcus fascians]MBY3846179.1 NAD(P)-binding domain-containing protein [Rhodococcus fascians]MBY3853345.1 NAD(P)-binding domain-containing protein [Rhodococcus fascians]
MKIGIIGSGFIGGTLVRRLTALGHEVRFSNSRDPETLAELASETGATAVWAADAAQDADLVILSIPQKNVPDLAAGIAGARKPGAPIIETNNYYPQQRDGLIEDIEGGTPESVWVSQQLGEPVIKAFNGIWYKHLLEKGVPAGTDKRIALPIAGDDVESKKLVFSVIDELGFDPVDAGSLAESWRQQPGTPVYGKDFGVDDTVKALAEASPERSAEWKA